MAKDSEEFNVDRITISFERPEELGDIIKLQSTAPWCADRKEEDLHSSISNSDIFVTARYDGKTVGTAMVLTDFTFYAVVFDVIVDQKFQSKGVGTRIMDAVQNHPRLRGVRMMWLFTRDRQGFYQKLGWQIYPGNAMSFKPDVLLGHRARKESIGQVA